MRALAAVGRAAPPSSLLRQSDGPQKIPLPIRLICFRARAESGRTLRKFLACGLSARLLRDGDVGEKVGALCCELSCGSTGAPVPKRSWPELSSTRLRSDAERSRACRVPSGLACSRERRATSEPESMMNRVSQHARSGLAEGL
mmetsp:Transcript_11478/g.26126  ORF Transcript_11478/g.26126 Transcript_11478/m.26126 type:complete len:144 (+) Transcript_11478:35-466(+)